VRRAALLFDLDGTLTDTDHLHFEAMRDSFAEHGVAVDWPLFAAQMIGGANADLAAKFLPHLSREEGLAAMARKEARFRARVSSLTRAAGLTELLAFAEAAQLPCALVTNAPRANATVMLDALDLSGRFFPVVIGDELARGKPDPLPYLTALETLGAQADASVAFEDSRSGVRAAAAAGVTTIGIGAATPADELRACGATIVAQDFTDPELWRLMRRTIGLTEGAEP
jgi:HAD superfamily hydrolase (TIGR01509 family)